MWAVDVNKFNAEKGALEYAMQQWGTDWLAGVNVGSESLYRKEITPLDLAIQIWDVKGMVNEAYKAGVPVGCADTWTSWVDGNNAIVIEASDVRSIAQSTKLYTHTNITTIGHPHERVPILARQ